MSTLVLCTVPASDAVIHEVRRVLKPGGRFLFIEHVRSDSRRLAGWPPDQGSGSSRIVAR